MCKKIVYSIGFLIFSILSIHDNARIRECANIQATMDKNNVEISARKQKLFLLSSRIDDSLVKWQISLLSAENTELSRDNQTKCLVQALWHF
jgi:hypothetical protein